jgi:hypothetical protein
MKSPAKLLIFSLALFLTSATSRADHNQWTYCTGYCTGIQVGWTWCPPETHCTVACYGQPGLGYIECT